MAWFTQFVQRSLLTARLPAPPQMPTWDWRNLSIRAISSAVESVAVGGSSHISAAPCNFDEQLTPGAASVDEAPLPLRSIPARIQQYTSAWAAGKAQWGSSSASDATGLGRGKARCWGLPRGFGVAALSGARGAARIASVPVLSVAQFASFPVRCVPLCTVASHPARPSELSTYDTILFCKFLQQSRSSYSKPVLVHPLVSYSTFSWSV